MTHTEQSFGPQRLYRSALYVDFDNLYSGLRQVDSDAADVFANDPDRLLDWLTAGSDEEGNFRRRFLVRDCYLNPQVYAGFRAQFVAAGFRVIDCPSLTQRGKSSADTHIVLDVVDALSHATRYDEFVICSADADFSPLMTKLRRHDRRTLMVAAGPYAAAYEAVCDSTIGPMQLLEAFSVPAAKTAESNEVLAAAVVTEEELTTAAAAIQALVDASPGPVSGATAAHAGMRAVPHVAAGRWGHEGEGFAGFVRDRLPALEFQRNSSGGWLLDPSRHALDSETGSAEPDDVVARVCRVIHAPHLTPAQNAALFEHLAEAASGHETLNRLGADVRERTTAAGEPVSRRAVNFVIQALVYAGHDLRATAPSPHELAEAWRANLRTLCEQAGLNLSDEDEAVLDRWVGGDAGR